MPTNSTKLRDNLWIGNWRPAHDAAWLAANSITAVLNLAKDTDDPDCGVMRFKQPLIDGLGNTPEQIIDAVQALHDLLDEGQVVYLHDISGCSRSAYIAARVLAVRESTLYDTVYAAIRAARPEVQWPEHMRPLYGIG